MGGLAGLTVKLSEERWSALQNRLNAGLTTFNEPAPYFHSEGYTVLICLVVTSQALTQVAMGLKGRTAGTDMVKLDLENIQSLPQPLPLGAIVADIPSTAIANRVKECFQKGGRLTDGGTREVIEAIARLRPGVSQIIDQFSLAARKRLDQLPEAAKKNLASQKDALFSALHLAGLSEVMPPAWVMPPGPVKRYSDGLPKTRKIDEATMLRNDFIQFPGLAPVMEGFVGDQMKFSSGSINLHVYWADKNSLELQTGTDLIYYNETFQSFVMVQYKAMSKDQADNPIFRLSDPQKAIEISRMESLWAKFSSDLTPEACSDFRFSYNPVFYKLCPRFVFEPESPHLIKGMYLPLDYWHLLTRSLAVLGPGGGQVISYQNVGRYLNNTEFAALVAKAWVGCRPRHSTILAEAVRGSLDGDRTAILAIKKKAPRPRPVQRKLFD